MTARETVKVARKVPPGWGRKLLPQVEGKAVKTSRLKLRRVEWAAACLMAFYLQLRQSLSINRGPTSLPSLHLSSFLFPQPTKRLKCVCGGLRKGVASTGRKKVRKLRRTEGKNAIARDTVSRVPAKEGERLSDWETGQEVKARASANKIENQGNFSASLSNRKVCFMCGQLQLQLQARCSLFSR